MGRFQSMDWIILQNSEIVIYDQLGIIKYYKKMNIYKELMDE